MLLQLLQADLFNMVTPEYKGDHTTLQVLFLASKQLIRWCHKDKALIE